jgi:hypothetical protein
VSLFTSYEGVPAFHQKPYLKRRPERVETLRLVVRPSAVRAGDEPGLTYEQFIRGEFQVESTAPQVDGGQLSA